jgi:hypothetical protein
MAEGVYEMEVIEESAHGELWVLECICGMDALYMVFARDPV